MGSPRLWVELVRPASLPAGDLTRPDSTGPRTRRDRAVDAAACLIAAVLGALFLSPTLRDPVEPLSTMQVVVDVSCGALACVALWWRRRWALGVALTCLLLGTFSSSATPAGLLALFSLAVHRPVRSSLLVAALWIPSLLLFAVYSPTTDPVTVFVQVTPLALGVTAWGMFIRARRQLLLTLRERALRAEADQRLHEDRARMAERTRIAREMHDVLAHRISLMALHAGGLEVRPDLPPAQVRETAELLRSTARQALEELRGVIGVLREEPGEEPTTPGSTADAVRHPPPRRRKPTSRDADRPRDAGRPRRRRAELAGTGRISHRAGGPHQRPEACRRNGGAGEDYRCAGRRPAYQVRNRQPVHTSPRTGVARVRRRTAGVARTSGPGWRHPRTRPGRVRRLRRRRGAALVTIKVLLVDDDALVRAGLRMILSSADDLEVVGEADDGARVLAAVREHRPDVVLMDIRMAEMDGITATAALRRLDPPPQVIVLTTFQANEQVMSALRAGANGFLVKDTPPGEIINAVRVVATGDAIISPSVTRTLLSHFGDTQASERRRAAAQRLAALTDREREVATAIGSGASNAEVAASLYMSEATVKAHVSRLFAKLDVTNRVQIAIVVHDAGQS